MKVATIEAEAVLNVIAAPRISIPRPTSSPRAEQSIPTNRRAPIFLQTPESVEVISGNSVELPCQG